MPVLELDDGTRLTQTNAIVRYLGTKYGMAPTDPLLDYHGESMLIAHEMDHWGKEQKKLFATPSDQMAPVYEDIASTFLVPWCDLLASKLKGKWLCGDQLTWYDVMLCGFFVNIVENPNNKGKASWDKYYPTINDRVK